MVTVREVIELLGTMPQDAEVRIEGCDCINPAKWVRLEPESRLMSMTKPSYVLIEADLI